MRTPITLASFGAIVACAFASACNQAGEEGGTPDAGDVEPPEILSAQLEVHGDLSVSLNFSSRDVEHILPRPGSGTFVVRARDDAATENLSVEVVDADGEPIGEQAATFENGLWRIDVEMAPGHTLGVRASDPDGNARTAEHTVTLPTLEEALADAWEMRFYDRDKQVTHRWTSEFGGGGAWSETKEDSGVERAGTFQAEATTLTLDETTRSGDDGGDTDSDPETVEERTVSTLYVDSTYASTRPFERDGDGDDHVGTWRRSWDVHRPVDGELPLAEEITETLVLEDDGRFSEEREVIDHTGEEPVATTTTRAGSYSIELNEDYTDTVGNFLARTVETVDGEPVSDGPELFDLHVVRLGYLLVRPRLRAD